MFPVLPAADIPNCSWRTRKLPGYFDDGSLGCIELSDKENLLCGKNGSRIIFSSLMPTSGGNACCNVLLLCTYFEMCRIDACTIMTKMHEHMIIIKWW